MSLLCSVENLDDPENKCCGKHHYSQRVHVAVQVVENEKKVTYSSLISFFFIFILHQALI